MAILCGVLDIQELYRKHTANNIAKIIGQLVKDFALALEVYFTAY